MNNISKNNYFMSMAYLTARRSKDPSTQCGAIIVNQKSRIVGLGYNGFPNGCKDDFPWKRDGADALDTKYPYVVHAEVNAILNATSNLEGCSMYTTLYPCNDCAKTIIQSGIKWVISGSDKYHDAEFTVAARRLFRAAGVVSYLYKGQRIEFGHPDNIKEVE